MSGKRISFYRASIKLALMAAVLVTFNLVSWATGFDHWLRATPTAFAVCRVLVVLIFGGFGLVALFTPHRHLDQDWRWLRFCGVLFTGIAIYQGVMLVTGAPAPPNPFVTE